MNARGKKPPLPIPALRENSARTLEPTPFLARQALKLKQHISDRAIAAYGLTVAEIDPT